MNTINKDPNRRAKKYQEVASSLFPSAFSDNHDALSENMTRISEHINRLRPQNNGPAWLGNSGKLDVDYKSVRVAEMADNLRQCEDVINETAALFHGMPNWGHPLAMCNTIPQGNTASVIAGMIAQVFSPNIVSGEYSWNVQRAELESGGMVANLIGWDAQRAGGLYTYGGSGCWTYHLKYALSRVLPGSRREGVRTNAKVLCSQQAHFTMLNSTDWTEIGRAHV